MKLSLLLAAAVALTSLALPARTATPVQTPPAAQTAAPDSSNSTPQTPATNTDTSFMVPIQTEGTVQWPMIPYVALPDIRNTPEVCGLPMLQEGSFSVPLTSSRIAGLFASEGASFPWLLGWDGCTLSGSALYDAGGNLIQVDLTGLRDTVSFSLSLAPEKAPLGCGRYPDAAVTELRSVKVTGWSDPDVPCATVELVTRQAGALFTARGASAGKTDLDAACHLAVLFANWMTYEDCPLSLDALRKAEHVPAWRSADFASLTEARQESAFAPFLPAEDPAGYGDFSGHLTYQEGNEHTLTVRWSRGYDDIQIHVQLPEGDTVWEVTDAANPAAYDLRLYEIPWAETVPEAYQETIGHPVFRAEDMSLAIVEARANPKDTGGLWFSFGVLHPDGTLVSYDCSGVTAEYVWSLVEATLNT